MSKGLIGGWDLGCTRHNQGLVYIAGKYFQILFFSTADKQKTKVFGIFSAC